MFSPRAMILPLPLLWGCLAVAQEPPAPAGSAEEFFDQAGSGLRSIEDRFRAYWQPHISNSHHRILQAAAAAAGRGRVLVLGAGNCTEIPLEALANRFEQVVLADLDRRSLQQAVESLPPKLQSKVEIRVADVTSFALPLMEQLEAAVKSSSSAEQAVQKLDGIYGGVSLINRTPPFPMADLVVSSLVLSELHRYPRTFVDRLMRQKFGTGISQWERHEPALEGLRLVAIQDHIALLWRFCRSNGAVYFADTVGRGPLYQNLLPDERREAMQELLPHLAAHGFFQSVLEEPASRRTFARGFQARRKQLGRPSITREELTNLLRNLSQSSQARGEEESIVAAETLVGMMCLGLFATEAEIPVFERLLQLYEQTGLEAFEPLVPLEAVAAEWRKAGLAPVGPPEDWWWLEYPCSVSHRAGAFKVKSWILKKNGQPRRPEP